MSNPVRKYTKAIVQAVSDGMLNPLETLLLCLNYMSEDDVEDMCRINDLSSLVEEEEIEEEEDVE